MMKNKLIIWALSGLLCSGCDKDSPGDAYEFSQPIPPYVAIENEEDIEAVEGDEAEITFSLRTALQQKVTVYYNVTGAITLTDQTAVIERNTLSATAKISIPEGLIIAPDTAATAVATLVKATRENGGDMTIGQKNDPENQHVSIVIAK